MADTEKLYLRTRDKQTVYLKNIVTDPTITVGDYTMYDDFVNDPVGFKENNVLYHYLVNRNRLTIGKLCSIVYDAKFLFNSINRTLPSLLTYPFPPSFEEWGLEKGNVAESWGNKRDIILGNDVWIGYGAVIMAGITIGDGAIIGARAVATKDIPPYMAAGGTPAKPIKKQYPEETVAALSELKWQDWPENWIAQNLHAIQAGQLNELK